MEGEGGSVKTAGWGRQRRKGTLLRRWRSGRMGAEPWCMSPRPPLVGWLDWGPFWPSQCPAGAVAIGLQALRLCRAAQPALVAPARVAPRTALPPGRTTAACTGRFASCAPVLPPFAGLLQCHGPRPLPYTSTQPLNILRCMSSSTAVITSTGTCVACGAAGQWGSEEAGGPTHHRSMLLTVCRTSSGAAGHRSRSPA